MKNDSERDLVDRVLKCRAGLLDVYEILNLNRLCIYIKKKCACGAVSIFLRGRNGDDCETFFFVSNVFYIRLDSRVWISIFVCRTEYTRVILPDVYFDRSVNYLNIHVIITRTYT